MQSIDLNIDISIAIAVPVGGSQASAVIKANQKPQQTNNPRLDHNDLVIIIINNG